MQFFIYNADNILYSHTVIIIINILKKYKEMIINITSDFKEHFQKINNKLQILSL